MRRVRNNTDVDERPSEDAEWLDAMVQRWTDVYKKSATTVVLLRLVIAGGPIAAADLREGFVNSTGWSVTERGLYRTLQRLASDGLVASVEVAAERTGAKRKDFTITDTGVEFLARISRELLPLEPRAIDVAE